jgi:Xaa-Pro aminopeptidase
MVGMQAVFFQGNRTRFMDAIHGGVAVIAAYTALQRTNDASFPFEQEASFWWLTGINQPDWWAVIDGQRRKTFLVRPFVSDVHQIFDGSLTDEDALKISGANGVISNDDAMKMLRDIAKHHSVAYAIGESPFSDHFDFVQNPAPKKTWAMLERVFSKVNDCQVELATLRAIKQPEEIKAMQKAINLTIEGFEKVKASFSEYAYEYEIEADFDYLFRRKGRAKHAYDPIIAAGKNACTLHYNSNTARLKKAELVVMDIGARVDGYAADITRTYTTGEPTKRQQQVHQAVETAHRAIIAMIKPGLAIQAYFERVDDIMKEALKSLDLLKSPEDYRKYFPHSVSHGLGVDVHDALGRPTELLAGMVLTVEPGIYIPEEGIGVRIEDDILVTENGHRNLSQKLGTGL